MRAGRLRYLVELQRATESSDSYGGASMTWTSIAKRTAGIQPISVKEQLTSDQTQGRSRARFILRYEAALALTIKDRIKWNNQIFNIESIINQGQRNEYYELLCVEKV